MSSVHPSVLSLVGSTPTVDLQRIAPPRSRIMVKLESSNPGRSIKDRAAIHMVNEAERAGTLCPGGTIVESTSGNLGKSLALIGAVRGYRVVLVVDPKTPRSATDHYRALGAEVILVDTPDDDGGFQRGRIKRVQQILAANPSAYWPDQYRNPDNPTAHSLSTALEIDQMDASFDTLVAAVSTGGHLSGISRTIKTTRPDVQVIAVDAFGSAALGGEFGGYKMRGMGLAWMPDNLGTAVYDWVHRVDDVEGVATMRAAARLEGLLVGESSGAVLFAAISHALRDPDSRVLCIAADDGANYLSESFRDDWDTRLGNRHPVPHFRTPDDVFHAAKSPLHPPFHTEPAPSKETVS